MKDILSLEVEKLTLEELKTAYYEIQELGKTGILQDGIARNIYNSAKKQNPSLNLLVVQVTIYEHLLKKLL